MDEDGTDHAGVGGGVFCCCGGLFRNPFIRLAAFLDKIGCDGGRSIFSAAQLVMDVPWHLSINQQILSEGREGETKAQ